MNKRILYSPHYLHKCLILITYANLQLFDSYKKKWTIIIRNLMRNSKDLLKKFKNLKKTIHSYNLSAKDRILLNLFKINFLKLMINKFKYKFLWEINIKLKNKKKSYQQNKVILINSKGEYQQLKINK